MMLVLRKCCDKYFLTSLFLFDMLSKSNTSHHSAKIEDVILSDLQPWLGTNKRENNLNFLRCIFALLVIFSHSYPILFGNNDAEPFSVISRTQVTAGRVAVAFFFILSGYLITQSWFNSRNAIDYLRKRVLRIYPGFIVNSLFCLLVVASLGSTNPSLILSDFKFDLFIRQQFLLYLPGVRGAFMANPVPQAVNGSAWTIRYEFWCYIVLLVLGLLKILPKRRITAFVFLIFFSLFTLQTFMLIKFPLPFETGRTFIFFGELRYYFEFITLFLSGTIFFMFREKIPYSKKLFWASIGLLVVTDLLGGLVLVMPFAGAYIIFYLGYASWLPFGKFGTKYDLTYGIYLYGYPIQQLIVFYFGTSIAPMTLFVIASAISAVFALFSWVFVEKPFMSLKGKKKLSEPVPVIPT